MKKINTHFEKLSRPLILFLMCIVGKLKSYFNTHQSSLNCTKASNDI